MWKGFILFGLTVLLVLPAGAFPVASTLELSDSWQTGDQVTWHYLMGQCYNNLPCESVYVRLTYNSSDSADFVGLDSLDEYAQEMDKVFLVEARRANDDAEPIEDWQQQKNYTKIFGFISFTTVQLDISETYHSTSYWIWLFLHSFDIIAGNYSYYDSENLKDGDQALRVIVGDKDYNLNFKRDTTRGYMENVYLSEFNSEWFFESTISEPLTNINNETLSTTVPIDTELAFLPLETLTAILALAMPVIARKCRNS